jgi:hypothetical protein
LGADVKDALELAERTEVEAALRPESDVHGRLSAPDFGLSFMLAR